MTTTMIKNKWARRMTDAEISNWIAAMIEVGRIEICGYWNTSKMIRCPFGKPLAIVG